MDKFLKYVTMALVMFIFTLSTAIAKPQPELFWSYDTGGTVKGVAISDDGNYTAAASDDGYLYFLNKSKELVWRAETNSRPLKVAISSDGSRVFVGDESVVYLYNKTGNRKWEFFEGNSIHDIATTPGGNRIVFGSLSYFVYLLDGEGNVLWKHRTNGPVFSVAISSDGELIFAGTARGSTYALNKNGKLLWEHLSGKSIDGVGILDDQIVSGSNFLNFLEDGRKVGYSTSVVCDISSLETTADKEYMLVGCEDGKVHFLDSSKERLWSYDVGEVSHDSSVSFDGDYSVVGGGNTVYILTLPDTTPPVVKITEPEDGATVAGIVKINADVLESSSYTLRVLIDGNYACAKLPCTWLTGATAEGEHEIYVEVNDSGGNVGETSITVTLKHTLLQNITEEITEKQEAVKETHEEIKAKLNATMPKSLPPLREHRDYTPIIKTVLLALAVYVAYRILRRPKKYRWKRKSRR